MGSEEGQQFLSGCLPLVEEVSKLLQEEARLSLLPTEAGGGSPREDDSSEVSLSSVGLGELSEDSYYFSGSDRHFSGVDELDAALSTGEQQQFSSASFHEEEEEAILADVEDNEDEVEFEPQQQDPKKENGVPASQAGVGGDVGEGDASNSAASLTSRPFEQNLRFFRNLQQSQEQILRESSGNSQRAKSSPVIPSSQSSTDQSGMPAGVLSAVTTQGSHGSNGGSNWVKQRVAEINQGPSSVELNPEKSRVPLSQNAQNSVLDKARAINNNAVPSSVTPHQSKNDNQLPRKLGVKKVLGGAGEPKNANQSGQSDASVSSSVASNHKINIPAAFASNVNTVQGNEETTKQEHPKKTFSLFDPSAVSTPSSLNQEQSKSGFGEHEGENKAQTNPEGSSSFAKARAKLAASSSIGQQIGKSQEELNTALREQISRNKEQTNKTNSRPAGSNQSAAQANELFSGNITPDAENLKEWGPKTKEKITQVFAKVLSAEIAALSEATGKVQAAEAKVEEIKDAKEKNSKQIEDEGYSGGRYNAAFSQVAEAEKAVTELKEKIPQDTNLDDSNREYREVKSNLVSELKGTGLEYPEQPEGFSFGVRAKDLNINRSSEEDFEKVYGEFVTGKIKVSNVNSQIKEIYFKGSKKLEDQQKKTKIEGLLKRAKELADVVKALEGVKGAEERLEKLRDEAKKYDPKEKDIRVQKLQDDKSRLETEAVEASRALESAKEELTKAKEDFLAKVKLTQAHKDLDDATKKQISEDQLEAKTKVYNELKEQYPSIEEDDSLVISDEGGADDVEVNESSMVGGFDKIDGHQAVAIDMLSKIFEDEKKNTYESMQKKLNIPTDLQGFTKTKLGESLTEQLRKDEELKRAVRGYSVANALNIKLTSLKNAAFGFVAPPPPPPPPGDFLGTADEVVKHLYVTLFENENLNAGKASPGAAAKDSGGATSKEDIKAKVASMGGAQMQIPAGGLSQLKNKNKSGKPTYENFSEKVTTKELEAYVDNLLFNSSNVLPDFASTYQNSGTGNSVSIQYATDNKEGVKGTYKLLFLKNLANSSKPEDISQLIALVDAVGADENVNGAKNAEETVEARRMVLSAATSVLIGSSSMRTRQTDRQRATLLKEKFSKESDSLKSLAEHLVSSIKGSKLWKNPEEQKDQEALVKKLG